jgi:hypothetical protein
MLDISPDLAVAVAPRRRKHRLVASALLNNSWTRDITSALTLPVLVQYIEVWQRL